VAVSGGQKGVMMVEALVAILIFSLGILGVVGMQARSVQMMTESVFRAQAAQHASALIADMWMTNPAQRANLYASAGADPVRYNQWKALIQSGATALPGAAANPPLVTVNTQQVAYSTAGAGNQTVSQVTVTVFWQPPGVATPSSYTTTAMIMEPQA
jgi:type IV pilus assembly protein PilV